MKKRKELQIEDKLILRIVGEDIDNDKSATSEYRENLKEWDELYRAKEVAVKDREFNIKLPLTKIAIKSIKARLMQLLTKRRTFRPTEGNDVEKIQANEDFFAWIVESHLEGRFGFLDLGASTIMTKGTVISSVTWEREEEKVIDYKYYPATRELAQQLPDGSVQMIPAELTADDIIKDLFPESEQLRITDRKEIGEDHVRIKYDEHVSNKQGAEQWKERVCEIDFFIDEAKNEIVARVEKIIVKFEGARERIENFDAISFPVDAENLQNCDHVNIEFCTTVSDLLVKRDAGIYDFTDEELDRIKAVSNHAEKIEQGGTTQAEKDDEGTTNDDLPANSLYVNGTESYYMWDVDGKGYLEQVIFTSIPDANIVVRKKHLNEIFRHGKRPLQSGVWDIRKHRLLGIGLIEEMAPLQKLINDIVNIVLNASNFALNPPGFYDPSMTELKGTIKYKAGELTPVPGPPPYFLQYPANFPVGFELLKFFIDIFQRDSAASDQIQGQRGGVSTATATVKLIQEAYQNMSLNISRVVDWIKQVDRQIWQLYRAYMPDNLKYRVMGPDSKYEFKEMTRADLLLNPDIALEVNVEETSKQYVQEVANEIMQTIAMNPLLLQARITDPSKIYNAAKNQLEAYGVKNSAKYLNEPEVVESIDPGQENYQMVEGKDVGISPLDNDQEHLQEHQAFIEAIPNLVTDPSEIDALMRRNNNHMMLHMQQAQMKAMQQAQMIQMAQAQQAQQGQGEKSGQPDNMQGKVAGRIPPGAAGPFQQQNIPNMGAV